MNEDLDELGKMRAKLIIIIVDQFHTSLCSVYRAITQLCDNKYFVEARDCITEAVKVIDNVRTACIELQMKENCNCSKDQKMNDETNNSSN